MKKCPTPAANEYEPDVTATSFAEPDRPPACHICVPAPSGAFPAIENALPESQHPCRGGGDDRGWPSPPRHRRKPFPIPRRRGCSSSAYTRTHSALKRVGRSALLHCFPGAMSPVHRRAGVSVWRTERAARRGVPGTTTVFQFLRADFPARRTFRKTRLFPKREKSGSCRSVRNIQPSSLTGRLET